MSELVVIAGQSNAGVFGLTGSDVPAGFYSPDPHVQILTAGAFQTMQPGVNTGLPNSPQAWGPEVAYAHDWLIQHPGETLYLVKSAKGSTSLVAGVAPNWSPEQPPLADGSPNGMFNKTTVLVNQAKGLTGLPVHQVLWMQGEQDATDAFAADSYRQHLGDVFAHMRSEWGADLISFGRIGRGLPYGEEVRHAQELVASADRHALLVDTDTLTRQPDGLHLSAEGAIGLGHELNAADVIGHALLRIGAGLFHPFLLTELS